MTDIDDNMRIINENYENLTKEFQEEKNNITRMIYDIKEATRNPEKKIIKKINGVKELL
jgi:hypothetical protein